MSTAVLDLSGIRMANPDGGWSAPHREGTGERQLVLDTSLRGLDALALASLRARQG